MTGMQAAAVPERAVPAGLREKLSQGRFVITLEVDPPKGTDPTPTLAQVAQVQGKVDAVNVTDSPMANLRMAPIAVSYLIQRQLGVEAIFHLTCRDRNLLGLQAELLGAAGLGVRNMLALTGDPPARGNHPDSKPVFDVDVLGLIRMAATLNTGKDIKGNELEGGTDFFIAVASNPGAADLDVEMSKLRAKVEAGGNFVQTQPIFDLDQLQRYAERVAREFPDLPVLYGVMPLPRLKSALYLRDKAGVYVPDAVLARLERGEAQAGQEIALETALAIRRFGRGVHLFPYRTMDLAQGVLQALHGN